MGQNNYKTFKNSSILLLTITDQSFNPLCKYEGVDLHCNYDFNNWVKGFEGIFDRVIMYDFLKNYALFGIKQVNNDIISLVKKNKPQYLVWPSFYFEVQESTFDIIRNMGTKVIGCFFDDIMRFDEFTIFYISHLDYIFTFDSNLILHKYTKFGVHPLILINPPSYNFFKHNNLPYKYNVSFVGAKFESREHIIQCLIQRGINVSIFGRGWENGYINTKQMINIFNTSKINLNFVKTIDGKNTVQLKGRIFEICMCGGFLLTEYIDGIENYFAIDKEIVCFHTIDEAIDKIRFYLKYDNLRSKIAEAGFIKTKNNYSFEKIFGNIFTAIKNGNIKSNYIQAVDIPDNAKKSRAYKHICIAKALYSEGQKDIWKDEYELAANFYNKITTKHKQKIMRNKDIECISETRKKANGNPKTIIDVIVQLIKEEHFDDVKQLCSEVLNNITNTNHIEITKNIYGNLLNLSVPIRKKDNIDIILIQPVYPSSPFPGPNLNVGLGCIAEQFECNNITYEVVDLSIDGKEMLFKKIKALSPIYIGLSLMSLDAEKHYDLINDIKKNFPKIRIIVGGPHVSFVKTRILEECTAIDYAIVHEGEYAIIELINNVSIKKIRGLIYRKEDGNIIYNGDRNFINDLDHLPFPKFKKFQLAKYGNIIPVATSRGCPYSCTFCGAHLSMGKKWRNRSVRSVVEELQYWYDKGYKNINFVDSNFFMSHQRVIELCDFLESKNIKITLTSDGMRAKDADREMLKKLKKFGLQSVAIGIESANDDILKSIKKAETLNDMEQCLELLKELNISVVAFFIIGLPGETFQHVLNSFRFALTYPNISHAYFFNPNPLPETEMYKLAEKNNMLRVTEKQILDNIGGMDDKILIETPELPIRERKILLKMSKDVSRLVELQHTLHLNTANKSTISNFDSINNEIKYIKGIMTNDMKMLLHAQGNIYSNDTFYKTIDNSHKKTQANSGNSESIFYVKNCQNTNYYTNSEVINFKNADAIFTHLTTEEKVKLMELASRVNGNVYVEIGSYLGASSCFIAAGIKKRRSNSKLFCVDTWQNDAMSEEQRDTYEEFLKNTDKYQEYIMVMRGQSIEVAKKFNEKIDFLFIDGDHSYEGVKSDVEAWLPKLNQGAVIIFHDIGWAEGVQRIITEKILQIVENSDQLSNMFWAWLKQTTKQIF